MRKVLAAAVLVGSLWAGSGTASAQAANGCPESPQICVPDVGAKDPAAEVVDRDVVRPGRGDPRVEVAQPSGALPVTGTDAVTLVAVGGVLIGGGAALVMLRPRAGRFGRS